MRTPIVGGNWKMNTDRRSAAALAAGIAAGVTASGCDVEIFPPFPYLIPVAEALAGSPVRLGGQDLYVELSGAFTGEVSPGMLLDCGAATVLVGHSERRHVLGEPDALVGRKLKAALQSGLSATLCVGETLDEREAGRTDAVNERQLRAALGGVDEGDLGRVVIAYEPVWAIGTGRNASPDDAQNAHAAVRMLLRELYDVGRADSIRIQYGGSVKPDNAADLIAGPDVDGFLVGGASLEAASFLAIVETVVGSIQPLERKPPP